LLHKLYGSGNVSSLSESSTEFDYAGAGTKVLSAGELQIKSLANQETKIKQQKKQLVARQALAKAQAKMRDASKPLA
jgi:hypothetical protein